MSFSSILPTDLLQAKGHSVAELFIVQNNSFRVQLAVDGFVIVVANNATGFPTFGKSFFGQEVASTEVGVLDGFAIGF